MTTTRSEPRYHRPRRRLGGESSCAAAGVLARLRRRRVSPAGRRRHHHLAEPTAGRAERAGEAGFTLLELIIVVAVIGILATIVLPRMRDIPTRAAEAALKQDLRTMRDMLDQFYGDKGHYPPSLETLVEEGYLRSIPPDPITRSTDTWVVVYEEVGFDDQPAETDLPEDGQPGVMDVRSGAPGTSLDGEPYSEW